MIYQTLVVLFHDGIRPEVARLNKVVQQVHKGSGLLILFTAGKGSAGRLNCEVNAVAALEAALPIYWGGSA